MNYPEYYRVKNERIAGVTDLYRMGEAVKHSNVYRSELLNKDQLEGVDILLDQIRKLYLEINDDSYLDLVVSAFVNYNAKAK